MSIQDAERIAELRRRCRERKLQAWPDKTIVDARSFAASQGVSSHLQRIGRRTRDRLSNLRLDLDDLELLVGRPCPDPAANSEELSQARQYLEGLPYARTPGQTGHCELDRRIVMQNGLDGALQLLADRAELASDAEQRDTCQAFRTALEGLRELIENARRAVLAAVPFASEGRRAELSEMAAVCARCAHQPPETFREALQLTWLVDLAVSFGDDAWLVSPGHLDRTLISYYRADIEQGRLTRAAALLLIECYYVLINEFVPDGLAVAVMVGGRDGEGRDLTNELSYLCLEALRRTKLVYPTVGICWHSATPAELVNLALELISQSYPSPAFFNDGTIQKGLQKYGLPPGESWNYINSTCVEITPVGASNVWVASPYFSVCSYLLVEIDAAAQSGTQPGGFEAFLQAYFRRLSAAIAEAVDVENRSRQERERFGGKPLQSVFTRDCIERGLDIDRGGARYNWIECSFVGLANLVDSLEVIRQEIFEKNLLTFSKLNALLQTGFQWHERERSRFQNAYKKYGHGDASVDNLMALIVGFVEGECARQDVVPAGARFVPGAFCWIMHEQLGRVCAATPDGRLAGTPFADGCGPAQGREKYGPTSAILSTTSWDHSAFVGGAAYNMKFNRQLLQNPEGLNGLRDLILTFLQRGGFETQVNVVDREILKKARVSPENYQDLIVRIGGYTDYFVRLSPQMQEEIISRTEFTNV